MNQLKNKTALITGGSGGIGFGTAVAFAKEGASLVLTDINEQALEKAKSTLEKEQNAHVLTIAADGCDEEAVKAVIEKTVGHFSRLDVLINTAQASKSGLPLIRHSQEDFDLAVYTGLYATFFYMKHAFPYLRQTKGSVINFASGAGISGGIGQASYAAAKEGIRALSRVAAREWGEDGINVNVVCPLALTETLKKWRDDFPAQYAENIKNIPMQRFGDPEKDIGRVCVFLASDDASYISGETLSVQGGSNPRP